MPIAFLIFMLQRKGQYMMKYDDLSTGNILNWANALLGLTAQPANGPLHFLRNLIACNIIALAIAGVFRRHAVPVFAAIVTIGLLGLDWPILTRNDMLIGFFLGGLVAVTAIDVALIDAIMPVSIPCFLVSGYFMFKLQIGYDSLWWIPHRLLGFLAAWPLIGCLSRCNFGKELSEYSKYTFLLFLSHYYAMLLSFAVFSQFFTIRHFYIYAMLAGPAAIGMSVAGQRLAGRYFPCVLGIFAGGRAIPSRRGQAG
jgi:succinoglycan biosynthesis protein ExoH